MNCCFVENATARENTRTLFVYRIIKFDSNIENFISDTIAIESTPNNFLISTVHMQAMKKNNNNNKTHVDYGSSHHNKTHFPIVQFHSFQHIAFINGIRHTLLLLSLCWFYRTQKKNRIIHKVLSVCMFSLIPRRSPFVLTAYKQMYTFLFPNITSDKIKSPTYTRN